MGKNKIITRTCGKCKKAFPVGRGHDVRTCGKVQNLSDVVPKMSAPLPGVPAQTAMATSEVSSFIALTNNNVSVPKRKIPREMFHQVGVNGKFRIDKPLHPRIRIAEGSPWEPIPQKLRKKFNYIENEKMKVWFNWKGLIQSFNDCPAVEYSEGLKEWREDGILHRIHGPARELPKNKGVEWWLNGKKHRLDGPAVEDPSGHKEWWVDGERHRLDGPALTSGSGHEMWFVNDLNMEIHADHPDVPAMMGDYFYLLCTNKNPRIRGLALSNPNCPPAWRIAGKLL